MALVPLADPDALGAGVPQPIEVARRIGEPVEVVRARERSALGQLALKLTVPGVPDIYQGDELIALSLVDPDNRRPVDWETRAVALDELRAGATPTRRSMKLHLISRGLDLRARRPEVFEGAYTPLQAGPDVCAFTRGDGELLVVVQLRVAPGAPLDAPPGRWRDVLDGREHELHGATPASRLVGEYGFALLERL